MPATRSVPPTILPAVTAIMFFTIGRRETPFCTSSTAPKGKKNQLAMECSKPIATNAVIGKRIAKILPDTLRAPIASQIARQTSTLHRTQRVNASDRDRATLVWAMFTKVCPTALSPSCATLLQKTVKRCPSIQRHYPDRR